MPSNMAGLMATALLLVANLTNVRGSYCTFYSDDKCKSRVGSVNYRVGNPDCFSNSGHFIKCDIPGIQIGIEQYPKNYCGGTPKAFFGFASDCTNIAAVARQGYQYKLTSGGHVKRDTPDAINGTDQAPPKAQSGEPEKAQEQKSSQFQSSTSSNGTSGLEKRAHESCQARIEYYYGGECKGPAAVYDEQVHNPHGVEPDYTSPCHNDGLYGQYILTKSLCNVITWEGENCSGKSHLELLTQMVCRPLHGRKYQVRSWQWNCGRTACNDQIF